MKILELKSKINTMKNSLKGFNSRFQLVEESANREKRGREKVSGAPEKYETALCDNMCMMLTSDAEKRKGMKMYLK